ncbi:hypothetical protein BU24DRAFT_189983 [Aaosphaeria arxii CBS 175.79]|uniref:Uncharacterized protein n=1 Tax=Aaosphaeria arxii CBS 175.79 TaxID=1450172 RepID=A0A6A5XS57_9PLEO|nr:uncharacterized protein BU24DRAFT_189983 [Aaosphaeria arxii CBS 175.79]KAF2016002.1 hypothetical protein BU24DRAFT_189983 [Aaosphaeria arxii CBS 175.79]
MRRGQYQHGRVEQSPLHWHICSSNYALPDPAFIHSRSLTEGERKNSLRCDPSGAGTPHPIGSLSASTFRRPSSPLHATHNPRSTMLPSLSSMNFPSATIIPPISSSNSSLTGPAQLSHLQELQYQISVKTSAFRTLQHEYGSLLQKFEQQRTKFITLEKKLEVRDVEINSLSDLKEKLQSQVTTLERQVEGIQESRDEARQSLRVNGVQYMRIMEMASRLQVQSAEDKKRWDAQKSELEQRIRVLEEATVTGSELLADASAESTPHPSSTLNIGPTSCSSRLNTINVLGPEIVRLRARIRSLEVALQTIKDESISIQAVAQDLIQSSGRIEEASHATLEGHVTI